MKKEEAGSFSGVDSVDQTFELDPLLLRFIDQVLGAPAEPTQFPKNKCVAGTKTFSRLCEIGAALLGSRSPELQRSFTYPEKVFSSLGYLPEAKLVVVSTQLYHQPSFLINLETRQEPTSGLGAARDSRQDAYLIVVVESDV